MDENLKKYIVIGIVIVAVVAMISVTAVIINSQNAQNSVNNATNSSISNGTNNSSSVSSSDSSGSSDDSAEYIGGEKVVSQSEGYSAQQGRTVLRKFTSSGKEYDYNLDGSQIPNPDGSYN